MKEGFEHPMPASDEDYICGVRGKLFCCHRERGYACSGVTSKKTN